MASKRIQGIQIPIGADTTPLQKALSEVNSKSKDLNKELKQVNNLLKLDPKNTELLAQKQKLLSDSVLNATEKLKRLKDAQQEVNKLFTNGEIDEGQYRAFNRDIEASQIQLNKLKNSVEKVNKTIQTETEKTNKTFESASNNLNKIGTDLTNIGNKMSMLTASIIAGFVGLSKGTEDLRNDLSKLETNANTAGISIETTNKAMQELSKVSKEADSNVEAISNILATGFNETEILKVIDSLSGAVIKFPDTLKIESLSDSLQETIATGKGVGQFAELLERLGYNIDDFNKGLQETSANGQEINYILNTLSSTGLSEVNKQFQESNKELVESNQATHDLKVSLAELGETVAPIFNKLVIVTKDIVGGINKLDDGTKDTIATIALLAASISPVLIISGKLIEGTGSMIKMFGKLKTILVGTTESVGLLSKALAFVSANPIIAIVAGVSALCLVIANSLGLFKSHTEKIKEAQEAYFNVKSELDSLNEELETTNDRMIELQAKGNLTLVEKDELSNLQKSNAELKRRKQLLEDEEKIKARQINEKLYDNYRSEFQSTIAVADDSGVMGAIDVTNEEYFKRQVQRYNELSELGQAMTEQQRKEYSVIQDELIKTSGTFEDLAEKVIIVDDKSKTFRDNLLELSDIAYKALHPDLWKNNKLNDIFNKSEFENVKNELIKLSKEGKLDESVIKSYSTFNTELSKIGVSANDVIAIIQDIVSKNNNLNTSIKYISSLIDEANAKTQDFSNSTKLLADSYNTLNSEENLSLDTLTALINKYPEYATEISKINDNKDAGIKLVNILYDTEKRATLESLEQTKAKILTETELLNLRLRLANISKSTWVSQEALNIYNQIKASEDATKRIQALQDSINQTSINKSLKVSASTSKSKDDVSKLYNERISLIENEIFLSEKLQSTLKEGSIDYLNELDKQIEKNKELQQLAHEEADRLRGLGYSENSAEVQSKISYWWSLNDKNAGLYKDKLDGISATYKEQNQILEDRIQLIELEQSKYNKLDDEYIQAEKEKYSIVLEQKKLISSQINELEKSNVQGSKERIAELKRTLLAFEKDSIGIIKDIDNSLAENQNNYVEKVKDSREKLEKAYIDMQKKQINETKKSYQDEIKWANEVYNTKKSNLQKEKDERYKNRDLEDKTKNVSDLQSQIDLIKNDETQVARYLELQEELTKAKLELDDTIYDNQYEKQVQALEDEQNKLNKQYEYQIELLEESLNDEKTMRDNFNREIANDNKKTYDSLIKYAKQYGETTSIEIKDAWDICTGSLDNFNLKQLDVNSNLDRMVETLREISQLTNQIGNINVGVSRNTNKTIKSVVPKNNSLSSIATNNISNSTSNNYYTTETPVNINQGNIIIQGNADESTVKLIQKEISKNNRKLADALGVHRGVGKNFAKITF